MKVALNQNIYFLKTLDLHADYTAHFTSMKNFDTVELVHVPL
jgi:hypothetical protein